MMLAYKAWRESRARFLMAALALGWFCATLVGFRPMMASASGTPFDEFVIGSIYVGPVRIIFILLIVALGMGGLAQEEGSVSFTLALPVSRLRLIFSRAGVGLLEVAALALLPTAAILGLAPATGQTFSVEEALRYSLQWAATGSVLFAAAFLLSVRLTGAYAALSGSILLFVAYASFLNTAVGRSIPALNVFALMERPHPSAARLAGAAALVCAFLGAAASAAERQDF